MAVTKVGGAKAPAAKATSPKSKSAKSVDHRFQQARRASILLKHVIDPTRLQVILILAEGERHFGALCDQLSQSQPAVSPHMAMPRHGRLTPPTHIKYCIYPSTSYTG